MSSQAGALTSGRDATGPVECDGSGFLYAWPDGFDIVREGSCPGCVNCADLDRADMPSVEVTRFGAITWWEIFLLLAFIAVIVTACAIAGVQLL